MIQCIKKVATKLKNQIKMKFMEKKIKKKELVT